MPAPALPLASVGLAAAACLVVGLNNPSDTQYLPTCPFKLLTGGLDCPGCGSTRALHQLLNADVRAALGFNAVMVVALPFVLYAWAAWALPRLGGPRLPTARVPAPVVYVLVGVILAWWVVRNLPLGVLNGLHSDR